LALNFAVCEVKPLFFTRLVYFLFLFSLASCCRRFRLEKILKPISGGIALIVFLYGIVQKLIIFPAILAQELPGSSFYARSLRARVTSGRIFAIFPLSTLYAMVCGLLLIFIVHFLLRSRRGWGQAFWALLFLLGAANLVLTQSFGGILFFTAGVLFYLFVSQVFKAKYLAPLLMLLTLVLSIVTALRFSEARELAPARLRFANWRQAGRVIASAPLLGVGLGNYEAAVSGQVLPGEPPSIYAHNSFLQFVAESGLPLFLLLAVMAGPFLGKALARFLQPENALFAAACIVVIFFSLFDVGIYFFAAGASFAVLFSQIVPTAKPAGARQLIMAALLAAVLLTEATATGRQRSGDLWLSQGDLALAEAGYRGALALNPFSYRARLGLAHIAWQKNDLAGAERHFAAVLSIFPGQPFANFRLSQAAQRRGAHLTALLHARRAAVANKLNADYRKWYEHLKSNLARQLQVPGD